MVVQAVSGHLLSSEDHTGVLPPYHMGIKWAGKGSTIWIHSVLFLYRRLQKGKNRLLKWYTSFNMEEIPAVCTSVHAISLYVSKVDRHGFSML